MQFKAQNYISLLIKTEVHIYTYMYMQQWIEYWIWWLDYFIYFQSRLSYFSWWP